MVEANRVVEDLEFKWGEKKRAGGIKKDFQFYRSFTYDGVEYELYDCVYLWADGEPEPHIGKLVKIVENPDKKKRVKVLWFFRPCEVLKYPGVVVDAAENELFLASGEGAGLANLNPLEAIAGKCKVVCTSKDSRNPQPSDEELQKADFIFYRAFDVDHRKILDKIEEKVAGIEVKFLFNRPGLQKPGVVLNLDSDKKGVGGNAVASNETEVPSKKNPSKEHKTLSTNGISVDTLGKEHADSNASLVKQKASLIENTGSKAFLDKQKSTLREHPASSRVESSKTNNRQENIPRDNTASRSEDDSVKREGKVGNIPGRRGTVGKVVSGEKVKSAKDCGDLEDRPAKKAKFDSSSKVSDDKNEKNVQKLSVDLDGKDPKALATITASEDKPRLKLAEVSQGAEKGPSKKVPDEKTKHSNGKLLKASPRQSPDVDKNMEVTRRPDADRSKWFRGLPWEERMKTANEQGALVLLQNLDPVYTSAEVEDIVWHGFKESCTAKMIQRTSISSSHCGQAFVIFKTREAAETVVRRLDEGCLLLSNGRPLVGSIGTPCFPEKKPTFCGHFVIDKARHQMPREMREAVSTSHCSQPNTIEYEMAMEWCLLQERSELSWKKLYKRQEEELKKLKSRFKSK